MMSDETRNVEVPAGMLHIITSPWEGVQSIVITWSVCLSVY